MRLVKCSVIAVVSGLSLSLVPELSAVEAAYVHVLKNDTADTRFHLSEVEAFANLAVPDELGGSTFDGLATSTNDIASPGTFGDGNLFPVIGTTTLLEHGGANKNPNNLLENAGSVWSTANAIGSNAQYTLDLGGIHDVTTVRLWPRADGCCANRWENLEIQLLDENQVPIPGTQQLHTANVGNVALEFTYFPDNAEIEDLVIIPALSYPNPSDTVVLSSAPIGTPVGDLQALLTIGGEVIPFATFSLVGGDGDTNNGMYSIGGVNNQQLLVNSDLTGLADVTHTVRVLGEASNPFEKVITFIIKADTDTDGLIDEWETGFGALGDFTSGGDKDGDGLNDEVEFDLGLNPDNDDGDGDGSKDGEEITNQTDPNDPDSDDDDLNDGDEAAAGSNPLNPDTDGDTIPDGEEAVAGVDGFVTSPILADTDKDGINDNIEIAEGTDPTDSSSKPFFATVRGRFIEVVKNDLIDTRFHLAEIELFGPGAVPDGAGGGTAGLSTNDLIDTLPLTTSRYLGVGLPTTTTLLEHGGGSSQTDNVVEAAGAVWSTANGLIEEARYVLDLGEEVNFSKVRLWARGDNCCTQRFQNLTVNLYDDNGAGEPGTLVSTADFAEIGPDGSVGPLELDLTEGAVSTEPLAITSMIPVRDGGGALTGFDVTWSSRPGRTYVMKWSTDMIDWTRDVDDSIASGGESTTYRVNLGVVSNLPKVFFRIEEAGP